MYLFIFLQIHLRNNSSEDHLLKYVCNNGTAQKQSTAIEVSQAPLLSVAEILPNAAAQMSCSRCQAVKEHRSRIMGENQ